MEDESHPTPVVLLVVEVCRWVWVSVVSPSNSKAAFAASRKAGEDKNETRGLQNFLGRQENKTVNIDL